MTKRKQYKVTKGYKVVKTSLTPLGYFMKKGIIGKKIFRKINLPKGSKATVIFYRQYNNTVQVQYIR